MIPYSIYRILATALLLVVFVSSSNSDTANNDSSLWNMIPDCARTCVTNFIDAQYTESDCNSSTNIKCLCRNKTPSGLTLGEAALSCTYALCDDKTQKNSNVYRICDSVPGAISETHATITATTFPKKTTSKTQTTTTKESLVTTTTSEAPRITTFDQPSATTATTSSGQDSESDSVPKATSSKQSSSTSEQTQESTTGTPTSTSVSDSNEKHHGVSAGTVIGVSVASGVAGAFIIGVAVFFCCKRWRRRRDSSEPDSQFFEIGGAMSEPPGFSGPSSRRSTPGPEPGPGSGPWGLNASGRSPEISEPQHSFHPASQYPPAHMGFGAAASSFSRDQEVQRKQQRIGFAVSSASDWADSPRSLASQGPFHDSAVAKPGVGLYPKPLKWSHRPASGETLFEEEEESRATTQVVAADRRPNMTQKPGSPSLISGLPANPRAVKDGFPAERFRRAPVGPRPTAHSQYQYGMQSETPGRYPVPVSHRRSVQRASYASNSSSTPNYSSDCSQATTSNTLLTTPGKPDPTASKQSPTAKPSAGAATLAPPAEIISRPRVVRGDDIKRVHIRSSPRPRPPSGSAPWGPDDLWLERGRVLTPPPPVSSELPYPSERCPGRVLYPSSPKKRPGDVPQRESPSGRNLTPSKRGADLILRVD